MFTVICHSYRLAHFEYSDRFDAVVLTHTPTGLRQRLRQFLNMMFFALATLYLITHDPQPASRADMASEGLPRLHAPIQPTCS